MNINLNDGGEAIGVGGAAGVVDSLQAEIDEHVEIMRGTGLKITGRVMLLTDPEYPGAYRVWSEQEPHPAARGGQDPTWLWVTPDGEVIQTQRPWAVTD